MTNPAYIPSSHVSDRKPQRWAHDKRYTYAQRFYARPKVLLWDLLLIYSLPGFAATPCLSVVGEGMTAALYIDDPSARRVVLYLYTPLPSC